MAQRLLFPFRRGMIVCGYKTQRYAKSWGYPHYGIDVSSIQGVNQEDHVIRASGEGVVVWCAYDIPSGGAKSLGWAVAIRYGGCIGRDGAVKDLVLRYMHASTCYVKKGQTVHAGDPILLEGMAGTTSYHVHIEADTDLAYPQYTPQVSSGHSGWCKGYDSTLNPSLWLWQGENARTEPYCFENREWINENTDTNIPFAPSESAEGYKRKIAELEETLSRMRSLIEQLHQL